MTTELRKFGPKTKDGLRKGEVCPACHLVFKIGDYSTLIPLGPGDDAEERQKARDGKAYNAVAVEVHWGCATGKED